MLGIRKLRPRRAEIRRNRPDRRLLRQSLQAPDARWAVAIALTFWLLASGIATLRDHVVRFRPGEFVHHDIYSRVEFWSRNLEQEDELRRQAREAVPRVYRRVEGAAEPFDRLERVLLTLPQVIAGLKSEQLPREMKLDDAAAAALWEIHEKPEDYKKWVKAYADLLRGERDRGRLVVLRFEDRQQEMQIPERRLVKVQVAGPATQFVTIDVSRTLARKSSGESLPEGQRTILSGLVRKLAERSLPPALAAPFADYTVETLTPTHTLDSDLTAAEQNEAAAKVSLASAQRHVLQRSMLVSRNSVITPPVWRVLADEQRAYIQQRPWRDRILSHAGMAGLLFILTLAMSVYTAFHQPRIIRNRMRAIAMAGLLLAALLVAQLAALGAGSLLIFGIAATLLAAMILAVAYDQRFAAGIGMLHVAVVSVAIGQPLGFFLIAAMGVTATGFLMDDIRSRGKPIEVGAIAALAMAAMTGALGVVAGDPPGIVGTDCLHVAIAGLGGGFVVLGILPFIEKAFRITTSMTLLELADVNHPLLKRLAMEAPGTYNHSLQVAVLAEAAADAIGADSLLCRVGSYYHDIGKLNKSHYFCENQLDGQNRHMNLTPSVSLLIIVGHVKDGIELAREYNMPPALLPIIQQHHGTTVVEYFYHQACSQMMAADPSATPISDVEYRYAGPRPRSREAVIVMLADVVESAARAMNGPTVPRLEQLVHDVSMKRLLDGQFDDADITLHELRTVERSLVKTLMSIYHGRLPYPSTSSEPPFRPAAARTAS